VRLQTPKGVLGGGFRFVCLSLRAPAFENRNPFMQDPLRKARMLAN